MVVKTTQTRISMMTKMVSSIRQMTAPVVIWDGHHLFRRITIPTVVRTPVRILTTTTTTSVIPVAIPATAVPSFKQQAHVITVTPSHGAMDGDTLHLMSARKGAWVGRSVGTLIGMAMGAMMPTKMQMMTTTASAILVIIARSITTRTRKIMIQILKVMPVMLMTTMMVFVTQEQTVIGPPQMTTTDVA